MWIDAEESDFPAFYSDDSGGDCPVCGGMMTIGEKECGDICTSCYIRSTIDDEDYN